MAWFTAKGIGVGVQFEDVRLAGGEPDGHGSPGSAVATGPRAILSGQVTRLTEYYETFSAPLRVR